MLRRGLFQCKHRRGTNFSPRGKTKVQVIWLSKKNKKTKEWKRINIGFNELYLWICFKQTMISLSLTNLWFWAFLRRLPIFSINKTKLINNKWLSLTFFTQTSFTELNLVFHEEHIQIVNTPFLPRLLTFSCLYFVFLFYFIKAVSKVESDSLSLSNWI